MPDSRLRRRLPAPFAPAAVAALLTISVAACGSDDDTETTADEPAAPETRQLEAPEESADQALSTEPVPGNLQGIDFETYNESMEEIMFLLDDYWAETLPEEFDVEYGSPDDVIAYYPEEGIPKCGGQPVGPVNASYCPGDNTIAWDEPGLMIPFYAEVGDAAVGFVLAHEWGHMIQNQLEAEFPLTIEGELNADCLAGTFAGALFDEGLLEGGEGLEPGTDLAEAAEGIFLVGDAPATPWQDPQAHGTGDERLEAFEVGYEGGPQACAEQLAPGFTKDL